MLFRKTSALRNLAKDLTVFAMAFFSIQLIAEDELPQPLSFQKLELYQNYLQTTQTDFVLKEQALKAILKEGRFLAFDLEPITKPLHELILKLELASLRLSGKADSLLTLGFKGSRHWPEDFSLGEDKTLIIHSLEGGENLKLKISGAFYKGEELKVLIWNQMGEGQLETESGLSLDFPKEIFETFYAKKQDSFNSFLSSEESRSRLDQAQSLFATLFLLQQSSPENLIDLDLRGRDDFRNRVLEYLRIALKADTRIENFLASILAISIKAEKIEVTLSAPQTLETEKGRILVGGVKRGDKSETKEGYFSFVTDKKDKNHIYIKGVWATSEKILRGDWKPIKSVYLQKKSLGDPEDRLKFTLWNGSTLPIPIYIPL